MWWHDESPAVLLLYLADVYMWIVGLGLKHEIWRTRIQKQLYIGLCQSWPLKAVARTLPNIKETEPYRTVILLPIYRFNDFKYITFDLRYSHPLFVNTNVPACGLLVFQYAMIVKRNTSSMRSLPCECRDKIQV